MGKSDLRDAGFSSKFQVDLHVPIRRTDLATLFESLF